MGREAQRATEALAELATALDANRQLRAQVRHLEQERTNLLNAYDLAVAENKVLRQQIADLDARVLPALAPLPPLPPDTPVTGPEDES